MAFHLFLIREGGIGGVVLIRQKRGGMESEGRGKEERRVEGRKLGDVLPDIKILDPPMCQFILAELMK